MQTETEIRREILSSLSDNTKMRIADETDIIRRNILFIWPICDILDDLHGWNFALRTPLPQKNDWNLQRRISVHIQDIRLAH